MESSNARDLFIIICCVIIGFAGGYAANHFFGSNGSGYFALGEKVIPNYNGTLHGGYACYDAGEGLTDCYFTPHTTNLDGTVCVACDEFTYHFLCFQEDQCILFEKFKRVEGGIRSQDGLLREEIVNEALS